MITNLRIMLDKCATIDDAVGPDCGTSVDESIMHNDGTVINACMRRNIGTWGNYCRKIDLKFEQYIVEGDAPLGGFDLPQGEKKKLIGFSELRQILVTTDNRVSKLIFANFIWHINDSSNLEAVLLFNNIYA